MPSVLRIKGLLRGDGVEFSTQVFYDITPPNDATNYKSGDTVDIVSGSWRLASGWPALLRHLNDADVTVPGLA
jgi:hypothetical protein